MHEDEQKTLPAVRQEASEVSALAQEMSQAYQSMVEYYRRDPTCSAEKAHEKASAPAEGHVLERLLHAPPDQFTWHDLGTLEETDPGHSLERWQGIKQAAREELQSGHRGAKAVEVSMSFSPWDRAQYLALREELGRAWQPQNGIEQTLLDQMAQAQTLYLHWLKIMTRWSMTTCEYGAISRRKTGQEEWRPPMLTEAASIDLAAGMVDRFQRLFVRAQRALRDLRRYAPSVIVQNAGQVNVASQQVNVAQTRPEEEGSCPLPSSLLRGL
jgi:hypothetical protein